MKEIQLRIKPTAGSDPSEYRVYFGFQLFLEMWAAKLRHTVQTEPKGQSEEL